MASFSRYALTPVDAALLAWLPPSTPPPAPDARCCAAFRQGVFAASIHDPTCCVRCWQARQALPYRWRVVPFGRIRRVPPAEAAQWERR